MKEIKIDLNKLTEEQLSQLYALLEAAMMSDIASEVYSYLHKYYNI